MTRRSSIDMAVVHLGRAMSSLDRSGLSETSVAFMSATRAINDASDQLIDAIQGTAPWDRPDGCFGHCDAEGWFAPCRDPEPTACPQPCVHLSQEDAREGKACSEHPCSCEPSDSGKG